jgi:hypothetical protein
MVDPIAMKTSDIRLPNDLRPALEELENYYLPQRPLGVRAFSFEAASSSSRPVWGIDPFCDDLYLDRAHMAKRSPEELRAIGDRRRVEATLVQLDPSDAVVLSERGAFAHWGTGDTVARYALRTAMTVPATRANMCLLSVVLALPRVKHDFARRAADVARTPVPRSPIEYLDELAAAAGGLGGRLIGYREEAWDRTLLALSRYDDLRTDRIERDERARRAKIDAIRSRILRGAA